MQALLNMRRSMLQQLEAFQLLLGQLLVCSMQVMGPDGDTGYRGSWWEAKVLAQKPTAGGGHAYTIEYSEVGLRRSVTPAQQRAESSSAYCGCHRSHQPHTLTA